MTNELLRRYLVDGSEAAFSELVRQHIDLVYSAALRQLNGDAGAAQDVAQVVFTDLARKASRLANHTSLTGWLYTSVRFEAAKSRRAEQRRRAREQASYAMNQVIENDNVSDAWSEMRPVLDEVMHELNDGDRDALLLRYFERKPLSEIGVRFGLSENAARMRVERALEKLRGALSKRGVTSTSGALALALTERAVSAAPVTLVAEISRTALSAFPGGASVTSSLLFGSAGVIKGFACACALTAVGLVVWNHHVRHSAEANALTADGSKRTASMLASAEGLPAPTSESHPILTNSTPQSSLAAAASVAPSPSLDTTNKMTLRIVTADSGKPVPSVDLDFWTWEGTKVHHNKPLHANRFGVCDIPVQREKVTKLILVSERDGFADTRLQWHTDQGEKIPGEYTLRLARAQSIGGTVLDADGNPVAGAKIGFNNSPEPSADLSNDTSDFGWPFWIETTTDASGHWQINRISKESIRTLRGGADHPAHLRSDISVGNNPQAEEQLIAGNYVSRLGRAIEVRGDVKDQSGAPIPGARVRVGYAAMGDTRTTKTGRDGSFIVGGCKPEKTPVSADAKGFATTTMEVDLTTKRGPFHLILNPGKVLLLRVIDANSNGVPGAYVFYDNMPSPIRGPARNQADFEKRTDKEGRVRWSNAPDEELTFGIQVGDHRRDGVRIRPDGEEHDVIVAAPSSPLTLFGEVTDAATGNRIPSFRIVTGWPTTNFVTKEVGAEWSGLDRFWLKFEGGAYRHVFTEPPLSGKSNPGFIFKFEANGYAPFITRPFSVNEGEFQLNVALDPAAPTILTVLNPDGQPAAKADIGLVGATSYLHICPGGLSHPLSQAGETLYVTDDAGHLSVYLDETVKSVVAANPQGFAQVPVSVLSNNLTIELQSWGRIEGTLIYDGQIATNRDILLQLLGTGFESISTDQESYKVTTDGNGHFVFPQAPPGHDKLALMIPFFGGAGQKGWSEQMITNVDVPPGGTITVTATTPIPPDYNIKMPSHPVGVTQLKSP